MRLQTISFTGVDTNIIIFIVIFKVIVLGVNRALVFICNFIIWLKCTAECTDNFLGSLKYKVIYIKSCMSSI